MVSDYNPIHLYPATAKLFGFKQPIAHGMFVAAKVFHEALAEWAKAGALVHGRAGVVLAYVQYAMSHHKMLHPHTPAGLSWPVEIDLKFIKPCFLPGKVRFRIYRADANKKAKNGGGEGPCLLVLVTNADKEEEVHLQGTLRAFKA